MMAKSWLLLIAFVGLSCSLSARQVANPSLSDEQQEGRRIFQQKCAVCHGPTSSFAEPYARPLTKGRVEGNEEYIREAITNGSGPRMPAWRYTLQPNQINNILAYLKTIEKPSPTITSERPEI